MMNQKAVPLTVNHVTDICLNHNSTAFAFLGFLSLSIKSINFTLKLSVISF